MKGVTTMGKIRILVATSRIALTLADNIVVVLVEVRILKKLGYLYFFLINKRQLLELFWWR